MPALQNGVLGCAAATILLLVGLGYIIFVRGPQSTMGAPQWVFLVVGIAVSVWLLLGLRRRNQPSSSNPSFGEELTEVHDWGGDRVEIFVAPSTHRGWVAFVRFGGTHLVWQKHGETAHQAYHKAIEFFEQACPDHQCGPGCRRLTSGGHEAE